MTKYESLTVYLDEKTKKAIEELQKLLPKMSKAAIARQAIWYFYIAKKQEQAGDEQ